MTPIRAVTLDFADTLFPHRPQEMERILEGVAAYLRPHLPPFAFTEFQAAFLRIRDAQFQANRATLQENDLPARILGCIQHVAPEADITATDLVHGAIDAYSEAFVQAMVMPSWLPSLIQELSERFPLAVISNYPVSEPIRRTLERDGLMPYLTTVVVSADIGYIKPHPSVFQTALTGLGNPDPATVIHVGDDWDADILGAAALGIRSIYTKQWRSVTDKHYGTEPASPLTEIDDLRFLPALLATL